VSANSPSGRHILSLYNKNAHTLFNGADESLFNPQVMPGFNFKVTAEDIVIGYAGNSQTYQGLDFLKKSFEQLVAKDTRFRLALLLSDQKEDQSLSPHIFVVAGLPHKKVPSFLASCDILVVPRLDNRVTRISFASKILEYMAMGKAVVCSDIGDANTVIHTKENGMLYGAGDTAGMIQAIEYLRDSETRLKIGENARNTVTGSYTNTYRMHFMS
jgi:glycosyltransferase involved in cell wall biosynthesis